MLKNAEFGDRVKVYARGEVLDSSVGTGSSIGNDAVVTRSRIGSFVSINRRNYINDSIVGDFTYTGQNTMAHFARIGRCCSIAANVDVGGFDHDYSAGTTLPAERLAVVGVERGGMGGGMAEHETLCVIGSDVWLASGVIVLRKASVGCGSVVGAGAVVTKDLPPYSIAVGAPARVVGYRFDEGTVERLLDIAWWDWPLECISGHRDLITRKVDREWLDRMEAVSSEMKKQGVIEG